MDTMLIDNAINLAVTWHTGQTRKVDGSPYIIHPIAVATMLAKNGFSDETIAAGYCHDLLEDTQCTEDDILTACGSKVLEIVKAVTNDDKKPWEEKKLGYIESVRNGPVEAKAVCVADKIHNLKSLIASHETQGPSIWKKFNRGKENKLWFELNVLKELKKNWNHPLLHEYEQLIEAMKKLK